MCPTRADLRDLKENLPTFLRVREGDRYRAQRIKSRDERALKIALQNAEGLEAAHDNSIIHRDPNPANVKVAPEGNVKVLDFGLAKAFVG